MLQGYISECFPTHVTNDNNTQEAALAILPLTTCLVGGQEQLMNKHGTCSYTILYA